jgi:hypothetical protein
MSDKLDELASEIDDAVITTEELKDEPGSLNETRIDEIKDALGTAQDAVDDLEDAEE